MNPNVSASVQGIVVRTKTLTLTLAPVSVALNDVLVAHVADFESFSDGLQTISVPSGWSILDTVSNQATSIYMRSIVAVKTATSADVSSPSYNFTVPALQSVTDLSGSVSVVKIVNAGGNPTQHNAVIGSLSGSNETYAMTITPSVANSLIMAFLIRTGGSSNASSNFAIATSNPTWTTIYDILLTDGATGTNPAMTLVVGLRSAVTATGSFTDTVTNVPTKQVGHLMAMSPSTIISVSDTLNSVDALSFGVANAYKDIVVTTEKVSAVLNRVWNNVAKNISNWFDTPKS